MSKSGNPQLSSKPSFLVIIIIIIIISCCWFNFTHTQVLQLVYMRGHWLDTRTYIGVDSYGWSISVGVFYLFRGEMIGFVKGFCFSFFLFGFVSHGSKDCELKQKQNYALPLSSRRNRPAFRLVIAQLVMVKNLPQV